MKWKENSRKTVQLKDEKKVMLCFLNAKRSKRWLKLFRFLVSGKKCILNMMIDGWWLMIVWILMGWENQNDKNKKRNWRKNFHVTKRKNDFYVCKKEHKDFWLVISMMSRHLKVCKASLTFCAFGVPIASIVDSKLVEFQLICNGSKGWE